MSLVCPNLIFFKTFEMVTPNDSESNMKIGVK